MFLEGALRAPSRTFAFDGASDAIGDTMFDPGSGDEQIFVQSDGVAVGHAGEEVFGGGVEAFSFDRWGVEEFGGALADFVPQAAEDAGGFAEFGGGDVV